MFKYLIAALLFLGTGVPGFSGIPRDMKLPGFSLESTLAYITAGNIHLLLHDYEFALADFEKAAYCIEYFDDYNSEYEFLILFGKTVAYDNLQLRDKCEHALQSLILTINENEDDEIDEEEGDDMDESSWEEALLDIMRSIAKLSPSDDIRGALLSIIDDAWMSR